MKLNGLRPVLLLVDITSDFLKLHSDFPNALHKRSKWIYRNFSSVLIKPEIFQGNFAKNQEAHICLKLE
jgi:hypothetical protein